MSAHGYLSVTVPVSAISDDVFENMRRYIARWEAMAETVEKARDAWKTSYEFESKRRLKEVDDWFSKLCNAAPMPNLDPFDPYPYSYQESRAHKAKTLLSLQASASVTFDAEDWLMIELWRQGRFLSELG